MPVRLATLELLPTTRATEWAEAFAADHELDTGQWFLSRPSYQGVASFLLEMRSRLPRKAGPRGVHVQIDLNGPGSVGGGGVAVTTTALLAVEAMRQDDAVRKRGAIPQAEVHKFPPRLSPADLGLVFDMAIDATTRIGEALEGLLLDGPAPHYSAPAGSMTGQLDDICAFDGLQYPRPDVHQLGSRQILQPPPAAPRDDQARAAVINEWLDTLVMALGYLPDEDLWP